MTYVTPHFTREELACRCGGCDGGDRAYLAELASHLEDLREIYGGPLRLSSAYRCPQHPVELAKGPGATHAHTRFFAADIKASGQAAQELLLAALATDWNGIGVSQKGEKSARFIHVDKRPERALWSY